MGRPRREDWQQPYLDIFLKTGTRWLAAHRVGVPYSVVQAEIERNPHFAAAFEETAEISNDRLERQLHRVGLGKIRGNPLPFFGLLKARRPAIWHDKLVTLNVNAEVHAFGSLADVQALLATMLQQATPATRHALEGSHDPSQEQEHADGVLQPHAGAERKALASGEAHPDDPIGLAPVSPRDTARKPLNTDGLAQ